MDNIATKPSGYARNQRSEITSSKEILSIYKVIDIVIKHKING